MTVVATSQILAVPRFKLRAQIAGLASAQVFLGVDQEADPIAAALAEGKMPDEIILDPEIKLKRPFIVVCKNEGVALVRTDVNTHWPAARTISVRFLKTVAGLSIREGIIEGSPRDAITDMENHVGQIMLELSETSGRGVDGDNLVFGAIKLTEKPVFNDHSNWANDCYVWAEISVEIDPGEGGG